MSLLALFGLLPSATVTVTRPAVSLDGEPMAATTLATDRVLSVEDVTGKLRSEPGGDSVDLALRLYDLEPATAPAYAEGDLVALTHNGVAVSLAIEQAAGASGARLLAAVDHIELLVVSRLRAQRLHRGQIE